MTTTTMSMAAQTLTVPNNIVFDSSCSNWTAKTLASISSPCFTGFCTITRTTRNKMPSGSCGSRVFCMAHPRRVKMVAQQIKREIGDMLIKDKVLQHAILPETAVGADMYLSSLATVSDVVVSNDLQVAKVYVSIFSDDRGKEIVMEGLKSKTKYVRAGLGKRMQLRLTPEVRFIMDESFEKGSRVLAILDRLKKEREEKEKDGESSNDFNDDDDDNWDDIEEVTSAAV